MKDEILRIMRMQKEGLLSEEQAADLLTALTDQTSGAREKNAGGEDAETRRPPRRGDAANGGADAPNKERRGERGTAAGMVHDFVDAAFGVGTTVGRVATVWGSEVANAVHRDEGGNSVTLSKVETPTGDAFKFRGNSFNVAKVTDITLREAEMCENSINASKVAELSVRRGRFSQCSVSGSSVNEVVIEGREGTDAEEADAATRRHGDAANEATKTTQGWSVIRGLTLNASKFVRVQVLEGSTLEGLSIQGSAVREVGFDHGTTVKNSSIRASNVSRMVFDESEWTNVLIDRSHVQGFGASESTMVDVGFTGVKVWESRVKRGMWKNVQIRRETTGREVRIEDSVFESCDFDGCDFVGCTFKRTTMRGVKAKGVTVRNVDFTGLVIEGEEMFRKAIGAT